MRTTGVYTLISPLLLTAACGVDDDVSSARGLGSFEPLAASSARSTAGAARCRQLEEDCNTRCTGSYPNTECRGPLTGTFDNVVVPEGASCDLRRALLTGNLQVDKGARARIGRDVFVCGDIKGDEPAFLEVEGARVCDNLQATEADQVRIYGETEVLKNGQVEKSGQVLLKETLLCGDAQLFENQRVSLPEGVVIQQNCAAGENGAADFSGVVVRGDDDGCHDPRTGPSGGSNRAGGGDSGGSLGSGGGVWGPGGTSDTGGGGAAGGGETTNPGTHPAGQCRELERDCSTLCTGSFRNAICVGTLTGQFDNVVVPPGASCDLSRALLTGNLEVDEGARADIGDNVFVCGDLKADESASVYVQNVRICDNLQATQAGSIRVLDGTEVLKNAQFEKSGEVALEETVVCGDAQLFENRRVEIPAGAQVFVEQNCSAGENDRADFAGVRVRGDNDGCRAAR